MTEFEGRQIAAVRNELDQVYEAAVGLDAKPSKDEAIRIFGLDPVRGSVSSG
jgi:hypothetical protein